jgi:hypothetical protein
VARFLQAASDTNYKSYWASVSGTGTYLPKLFELKVVLLAFAQIFVVAEKVPVSQRFGVRPVGVSVTL